MDLAVVYHATEGSYMKVLELLRKNGLNPVALESQHSDAIFVPGASYPRRLGRYVYIAVPHEERLHAEIFLKKMEAASNVRVSRLSQQLKGSLLLATIISVALGIMCFLVGFFLEALPYLGLFWFGGFIILAMISSKTDNEKY